MDKTLYLSYSWTNDSGMKAKYGILLLLFFTKVVFSQCPDQENGIVWKGNDNLISLEEVATYAAPMLWFSPDELLLFDENGKIQLPNPFPFDESDGPIVYYKFKTLYTNGTREYSDADEHRKGSLLINLDLVKAIDLDFYYYFEKETGLGSHDHDIESVALQLAVVKNENCPSNPYGISVKLVTAKAHGLHWYNNVFEVDSRTFFPLSILIEEGKHASCTDKNADGAFTPGYDVTKRINDAWGVRDIITSGKLVSGGYQAWMTKTRTSESILFPPLPRNSIHYQQMVEKFGVDVDMNQYKLKPYPDYPRDDIEKELKKLMKGKKPHRWPTIDHVIGDPSIKQLIKEDKAYRSFGLAYRWDDSEGITATVPLLIFKTVEAPMTGGYLFNKFNFGGGITTIKNGTEVVEKFFGHQIVHSSSASKWMDMYVGFGYDLYDTDLDPVEIGDLEGYFASEVGLKVRMNVSKTPLRFLKWLGTEFWGIRIGWKNVGFHPFVNSGFIIEIGGGVF